MPYDENGNYYDDGTDQLNAAFEENPAEVLKAFTAEAVRQTAAYTAQAVQTNTNDLYVSQAAVAARQIDQELSAEISDWQELKPQVLEVLNRNPGLLGSDIGTALDPARLKSALKDAARLARDDAAEQYASTRWEQIQNAPTGKLDFS